MKIYALICQFTPQNNKIHKSNKKLNKISQTTAEVTLNNRDVLVTVLRSTFRFRNEMVRYVPFPSIYEKCARLSSKCSEILQSEIEKFFK